jgi:hypothetical protein
MPDEAATIQYITATFENVQVVQSQGTSFFFYGPMDDGNKFPFATLVTNDFNDQASNLERPGVFRLNVGVSKATFLSLFGQPVGRPNAAGVIESGYDYTALDQIMPHPVYGNMYWVCVLNPGPETFERVKPWLAEAYATAVRGQTRRETDEPHAKPD